MALGYNSRDRTLDQILRAIFDRLARVEHPRSVHFGPIAIDGSAPGFTISVNPAGQLVATSDDGNATILASP